MLLHSTKQSPFLAEERALFLRIFPIVVVSADDLDRDYLLSNFGAIGSSRSLNRVRDDYLSYIQALPGDTLSHKIEGYLLSIGVAQSDIDTLRAVMLDGSK